jgi:hypothetical protein
VWYPGAETKRQPSRKSLRGATIMGQPRLELDQVSLDEGHTSVHVFNQVVFTQLYFLVHPQVQMWPPHCWTIDLTTSFSSNFT